MCEQTFHVRILNKASVTSSPAAAAAAAAVNALATPSGSAVNTDMLGMRARNCKIIFCNMSVYA